MLRDRACFVQLLLMDLVLNPLSPSAEAAMPPLRIDLAKDDVAPRFTLNFIVHFESVLTEFSPENFLVPLAQERVHVESCSSF